MKHNIAVLSGEIGSSSRTKKIHNMLNVLDKSVADARNQRGENGNPERIRITSSYLATELNYSRATITRNGFPNYFTRTYDSVKYQQNKGLVIHIDDWVEERKQEREELSKVNSGDQDGK